MAEKTKVACVQVNAQSDMAKNIANAEELIREAHAQGARYVALPENAFLMHGEDVEDSDGEPIRQTHTMDCHPGLLRSIELAKELNIWLMLGSIFVDIDDSGKWANRSVLINARGQIVKCYDKIHLFEADFGDGEAYRESSLFLSGKQAQLAQVPFGELGMSICYDVRFARLYRDLARCGATVLSIPAAFAKRTGMAHWHVLLRARAIENGCYVIAPDQCGVHPKGRETYGHSMIIDPWGEILAEAGDDPCVITATIDPQRVKDIRKQMPVLQHDRDYVLQDYVI